MENLQKFNSMENLVPFQSLSADQQRRCIELYGDPDDTQRKGIVMACKNPSETDIQAKPCKVEYQSQLPHQTVKVLCKTCNELSNGNLFVRHANNDLNGNTPDQPCLCQQIVRMNQHRHKIGAPQISHSQVCRWMQDVAKLAKRQLDNDLRLTDRNSLPKHSASNA